jgi:hypothetical protein
MTAKMTILVTAIVIVIALVALTYAWGVRHPGPEPLRRGERLRRRLEERDLL